VVVVLVLAADFSVGGACGACGACGAWGAGGACGGGLVLAMPVVEVVVADFSVVTVVVVVFVAVVVTVEVDVVITVLRFQTCSTTILRRTCPPCDMASTVTLSLESVMSMKPYWSSFPPQSGACSEVTPPPPPETTQDTGSKKSVHPAAAAFAPQSGQMSCDFSPTVRVNCECL